MNVGAKDVKNVTRHKRITLNDRLERLPQRVRSALVNEEDWGRVVVLCAEPGMGTVLLATAAATFWSRRGVMVRRLNLHEKSSAFAVEALADVATQMSQQVEIGGRAVVVVDGMPVPDECDFEQQANSLQDMAQAGCLVIVCLLPEAEQFVEELPFATRIDSDDLLRHRGDDRVGRMWMLTHGMPEFVEALEETDEDMIRTSAQALSCGEYRRALVGVVTSCVRHSLPIEECRARLSMMLLGSGTVDEVMAVVDRLDEGVWNSLEHAAPFFGVDGLAGTFSCAGLSELDGLRSCGAELRLFCEQMPEVAFASTVVLAGRGDYKRASVTCGLCRAEDSTRLACEWGVEFACVGEDALVTKALMRRVELGIPETESSEMADIALSVLRDPASRLKVRTLPPLGSYHGSSSLRRRRRYTELLQACRDLDRGIDPGRVAAPRVNDDDMATALVEHVSARRLLLAGEFAKVHALLVDNVMCQHPTTLVAAMLCDDYEIARVLIGEKTSADDQVAMRMADQVFAHVQAERLRCYHAGLAGILAAFASRSRDASFSEVIGRAEKMGDEAVRSVALLAAAIVDVRKGAYTAGHVRACHIIEMAGGPVSASLVDAARLVEALVQNHLRDGSDLHGLAGAPRSSVASDMALLSTTQPNKGGERVHLRVLSYGDHPRNELWMLNVILNDFEGDEVSRWFRQNIPKAWTALSRKATRRAERIAEPRSYEKRVSSGSVEGRPMRRHRLSGTVPASLDNEPRVELHVLGGVRMFLDGQDITSRLGRRRVKPYLILLAAARGHELGMFEIMDSLWPGVDLSFGRQRVYSANCELRKAVGSSKGGVDPIAQNRGDGTIRLNPAAVKVDVDDFERAANEVLHAVGDDELVLRLSVEAVSAYPGDLASTPDDSCGIVAKRRDDLRELYVDVAIAGSRAALAEGRVSQAVQFAKWAYGANDMREDVVAILIESLETAGRDGDACAVYDTYSRQLLSREGRPPASGIRRLIEGVYNPTRVSQGVVMSDQHHEDLLFV